MLMMMGKIKWLAVFFLIQICSQTGWAKEVELVALGVRAGMNFKNAGLPPGEKEDFEQFDVFAVMGLPWKWESPSGWEVRAQLGGSAGALRGAGETGFITEITGGPALKIPAWRLILDAGVGGALLSDWKFGSQDIGGPFQFIAHAGAGVQLPWNMVVGWRFHHMSDATMYGSSRGVDFHMLELSYAF
jgi:hypothetical protein